MFCKYKMPSITKKDPRCELRSWELIYDLEGEFNMQVFFKELCGLKFGVLKGFACVHTEDQKSHVHVGLITRDKPKTLLWKNVKEYFTLTSPESRVPKEHGPLKKRGGFDAKLQQYYEYCTSQEKHEGQTLGEPFLWKWKPKSRIEQLKPEEYLRELILGQSFTEDDLDELCDDESVPANIRFHALKNYDTFLKCIDKLEEIRARKRNAKKYEYYVKMFHHFQKILTNILGTQNDRNIHCHFDEGGTGKNFWLDVENLREDTLVLHSVETKRIAYMWNPRKHKRIIFDIPRGKMQYLNHSVIEALKNGTITSTMHHPKAKKSEFKPAIVILGNEMPSNMWTKDRLTMSTTDKATRIYKPFQSVELPSFGVN